MGKLRQLEERLRAEMDQAGCVTSGYRCQMAERAARELDRQVDAMEAQIADSRRMLGILVGSGVTAVVLILIELLRIRQFIDSFDIAIIALCAIDLLVCMGGAMAELRKIENARSENGPA